MVNFRVTWSLRSPLTEVLQVVHCHVVARKVQETIKQGRTMTCRKNKTVSVCPVTACLWINIHHMVPKHISHWRCTHRKTWVPRIRGLNCLDRKRTNSADRHLVNCIKSHDSNSPFLEKMRSIQTISV